MGGKIQRAKGINRSYINTQNKTTARERNRGRVIKNLALYPINFGKVLSESRERLNAKGVKPMIILSRVHKEDEGRIV